MNDYDMKSLWCMGWTISAIERTGFALWCSTEAFCSDSLPEPSPFFESALSLSLWALSLLASVAYQALAMS